MLHFHKSYKLHFRQKNKTARTYLWSGECSALWGRPRGLVDQDGVVYNTALKSLISYHYPSYYFNVRNLIYEYKKPQGPCQRIRWRCGKMLPGCDRAETGVMTEEVFYGDVQHLKNLHICTHTYCLKDKIRKNVHNWLLNILLLKRETPSTDIFVCPSFRLFVCPISKLFCLYLRGGECRRRRRSEASATAKGPVEDPVRPQLWYIRVC